MSHHSCLFLLDNATHLKRSTNCGLKPLLFRMRFTTARLAYNHGNRLGYLGYGVKPGQSVVGPSDTRAFRDLKLGEVSSPKNIISKD